jgi:catechol 2,3-dioxygenase-like lactoylglutathione lyase family enzyme
MEAQATFYRDTLGLKLRESAGTDDLGSLYWLEFDTGSCTLALHGGGHRRLGEDAPKIVFRVAEVGQVREKLRSQGVPMGETRVPAPGVQVCDGTDPEGNHFSIESRGK